MDLTNLTNLVLELEKELSNIEQSLFDKKCDCKNIVF